MICICVYMNYTVLQCTTSYSDITGLLQQIKKEFDPRYSYETYLANDLDREILVDARDSR